MDYPILYQHPTQFLAFTSLLPAEFDNLFTHFVPKWERYYRYRTLEGKVRQQPAHLERAYATLFGLENKLLFLLVYLKTLVV